MIAANVIPTRLVSNRFFEIDSGMFCNLDKLAPQLYHSITNRNKRPNFGRQAACLNTDD